MAVQTQIQVRRGTAATWTSTNPTLAAGEWGLETDTGKYKIGTGSAVWTSLGYASILPSTVTTKGDLLAASGNATVTRQAVGSDGYQLVADSSQNTGLGWAGNVAAGKNAVINGGFDIWQRGTSFAATATTVFYTADRWCFYANSVTGRTISQQTSVPSGFTNSIRVQRDSGNTNTQNNQIFQIVESSNVKQFQGQYITVSFWAKVGANYSPSGGTLGVVLYAGTGTDQNPYTTGYTSQTTPISTTVTPTTSWAKYSVTTSAALATTINEFTLAFSSGTNVGTAGANDWFEITGVQLELGSSATPFSRAGGSIGGELALCQRYYWRSNAITTTSRFASGFAFSSTVLFMEILSPVTMRVAPTSVDYSTVNAFSATQTLAISAITINNATPYITELVCTVSSATTNTPFVLSANGSTSAYLGLNAEL